MQTQTARSSIFREIITTSFDSRNQNLSELDSHFDKLRDKIQELDHAGFTFTRDEVISVLYQASLSDPLFERINHHIDREVSSFKLGQIPPDRIMNLARSQLIAFRQQVGVADQSINPTNPQQDTPLSTPQSNEINSWKRPNHDTQTHQRAYSTNLSHDVIYHLPSACRLLQNNTSREHENHKIDLSFEGASAFEAPFYKHLLHTEISSIDSYNQRFVDFLEWCSERKIQIHPQLTLQLSRKSRQLCVKLIPSSEDQPTIIAENSIVASIPKPHCFTLETSSLRTSRSLYEKFISTTSFTSDSYSIIRTINEQPSLVLRLTIHLAHELSLGSQSPWFPYLNLVSHPDHHMPALIHLLVDRVPELEDWFQGTEIARLMTKSDFYTLSFLKNHFHRNYPQDHITWECFLKAFTIVSSRAFEIDQYHRFGLVPVADLFDHSDEPDVQFVSQVYVCPLCGSQAACLHCYRSDDPNYHRFLEQQSQSMINKPAYDHAVELKSVRALMLPPQKRQSLSLSSTLAKETAVKPQTIYNSYGELSNATLLTRYGFMIAANSHDKIYFDLSHVVATCKQQIYAKVTQVSSRNESNEPRNSSKQVQEALGILQKEFESDDDNSLIGAVEPEGLWIDSNSKISPALWLTVVYETWNQSLNQSPTTDDLKELYLLHQFIHSLPETNTPSYPQTDKPIALLLKRLASVAATISDLAFKRQARYHLPQWTIEQLLNLKDGLISNEKQFEKPRLRIPIHQDNEAESLLAGVIPTAIEYSVSERILLRKTVELWELIYLSSFHILSKCDD